MSDDQTPDFDQLAPWPDHVPEAGPMPEGASMISTEPYRQTAASPGCRTCTLKGADVSWGTDGRGDRCQDVSAVCNHPDGASVYIHGSEDVAPEKCPLRKGPLLVRLRT